MRSLKISVYILLAAAILDVRNVYGMSEYMFEPESESLSKKRSSYYKVICDNDSGDSTSSVSHIDLKNVLYEVKDRHAFRKWLSEHYDKETECWIFVKRGIPKDDSTFWYLDAVEEALCFGWIDSVHKNADGIGHIQKMSPRKKNSPWSELNKERCRRLEKLGLMTPAGQAVLLDMSEKSFVIDPDVLKALQEDPQTWENFQKFPPLYQRVRIDTVQREKKKKVIYERMLKRLLKSTKRNIMFGEWNDRGRLLDY